MELNNILVISGKPDLSEVISQTKNGAIVKNLVTGVKFPVFRNERISSLGEIRIYTPTARLRWRMCSLRCTTKRMRSR